MRERGFPGKAVHKAELRSQMLLYQALHAKLYENDIKDFLKTFGFHQKYSDIKTPTLGFDFETCSAQPTSQVSVGGIIDMSMGGIYNM